MHDITRKESPVTRTVINAEPNSNRRGVKTMLKPSFRLFIIPLGAICTLASLSAQNTAPRAHRDSGLMLVRQQVVDCSSKNPREICVISNDSETSAR